MNDTDGTDLSSCKRKAEPSKSEAIRSRPDNDIIDDENYRLALVKRVLAQYVSTYYGDATSNSEEGDQERRKTTTQKTPGHPNITTHGQCERQSMTEADTRGRASVRNKQMLRSKEDFGGERGGLGSSIHQDQVTKLDKHSEGSKVSQLCHETSADRKPSKFQQEVSNMVTMNQGHALPAHAPAELAGGGAPKRDMSQLSASHMDQVLPSKKRKVKGSRKDPPPSAPFPVVVASTTAVAARSSSPNSSQDSLPPPEESKEEKKRRMNRITAKKKRARQKIELEVLADQCSALTEHNQKLRADNEQLEKTLHAVNHLVSQSGLEPVDVASAAVTSASVNNGSVPKSSPIPVFSTTTEAVIKPSPFAQASDPQALKAASCTNAVTNMNAIQYQQQHSHQQQHFATQSQPLLPPAGSNQQGNTISSLQQLLASNTGRGGNPIELLHSFGSDNNPLQQLLLGMGGNVGDLLLHQRMPSSNNADVTSHLQRLLLQGDRLGSTTNGSAACAQQAQHDHGQYQEQLQRLLQRHESSPQAMTSLLNASPHHQPQQMQAPQAQQQQEQPQITNDSSRANVAAQVLQLLQSGHLNQAQAQQLLITAMSNQTEISSNSSNSCVTSAKPLDHQQSILQQLPILRQLVHQNPPQQLSHGVAGSNMTNHSSVTTHSNQQSISEQSQLIQQAQQLLLSRSIDRNSVMGTGVENGLNSQARILADQIVRAARATNVAQLFQSLSQSQPPPCQR